MGGLGRTEKSPTTIGFWALALLWLGLDPCHQSCLVYGVDDLQVLDDDEEQSSVQRRRLLMRVDARNTRGHRWAQEQSTSRGITLCLSRAPLSPPPWLIVQGRQRAAVASCLLTTRSFMDLDLDLMALATQASIQPQYQHRALLSTSPALPSLLSTRSAARRQLHPRRHHHQAARHR